MIDSYMAVAQYPVRGQDVFMHDSFDRVGGCSINVAQTLKNLGMKPYVVSAVGRDSKGNMIMQYLQDNSFNTDCIRQIENGSSGYCATILEDGGERTFLTYKGCESYFSADMIPDELIADTLYVYVTGYYLLDKRYAPGIIDAIERLKERGSKILFDPGPLVHQIEKDTLLSIISKADIITPNDTEACSIKRILSLDIEPEDWSEALDIEITVLKQGSRGVKAWSNNMGFEMPAFNVEAVDTTGAGDSFAAGLIYGMWNNLTTYEAVKLASGCGAVATTYKGPHGKFGIEDVKKLINSEKGKSYDR